MDNMNSATATATVIVSRRVREGREAEHQRWLKRILRAASKAPGFVDSSVRPPGPDHPDDWVIVYQFDSVALLDDWLASAARRSLMGESEGLLDGAAREQRLVEPSQTVTLVSSVRLRPGTEAAHRELHEAVVAEAGVSAGLVRAELVPAVPGAQEETVALLTFEDRATLDRWLVSDVRLQALDAMATYAEGERTTNVVGDFAGWFQPRDGATPRWRQALVVWVALVPVALAVGALRVRLLPDMNGVVAVGLVAAVNVVLLTWFVMPLLTRLLGGFLAPIRKS